MKYLIAISGPIASGKSVLAGEIQKRFETYPVSTRQLLVDAGTPNDRNELIEAGKRLDALTDGAWIRDGSRRYIEQHQDTHDILLIDAVRTERQVHHLREAFGEKFVHIHVSVPFAIAKERYERRRSASDLDLQYEDVRADSTESGVWHLDRIADRVVANVQCDAASLVTRATAGLGLFPLAPERLVDVLVGGQYGSEGKGNICAYLAHDYDVLVRVGGPNAGHMVAYPEQKYVQLPSGTRSNLTAKILIGAGATIWPEQILKEIAQCGLTKDRLVIDERAMIIEQSDRDVEAQLLDGIASTKQGVGAATARKIIGRGCKPPFGDGVRLASDHPDLKAFVRPVAHELENAYASGLRVMLEGTQGTSLSLHHGHYPFVTSRETTASGCLADAGIAPNRVRRVIMVTRTYPIRVGGTSGPMQLPIEARIVAERSGLPLHQIEKTEVGTISGTKRRMAEFDWEQFRRSAVLNGATDIALTFADYITAENQNAQRFEQLSDETRRFIAEVEHVANAPVSLISTRFHRFGVIDRRTWR
ncbi:adenylosuccinate synthetase [Bradyrhizobium cenepequi]|uniref:adenylosuccinate synthetase n=1 Tax=Bradyrhizobium cenepequi TaxID=2821403 RepID=UPI001CE23A46|nr:adenylosuccinate synthetase [Bradyrhizobium cenepequi]MCA6108969.1 adenylosuccinate synthetase [Bradyrhizobium cenepequi]